MSARKVTVTLSAAGVSARMSVPLDLLTAALYEAGERLAGADDGEAGQVALVTMAGIGGIDLTHMCEAFLLGTWSDQLDTSEVTRWNACAQRAADIFGATVDTAGVA